MHRVMDFDSLATSGRNLRAELRLHDGKHSNLEREEGNVIKKLQIKLKRVLKLLANNKTINHVGTFTTFDKIMM